MKVIKLTKTMLKMHPVDLLLKIGAASVEIKQAFPDCVYMSPNDLELQRKYLEEAAKKSLKGSSKKIINLSVQTDMLNYSPVESSFIKDGHLLIDDAEINYRIENGLSK